MTEGGSPRDIALGDTGEATDPDGASSAAAAVVPAEVLDKLPPAERRQLESVITTLMAWGPTPNPFAAKLTTSHIDKVLDMQSTEMQLSFQDRRDSRRITSAVLLLGSALVVLVVLGLALTDHDATLNQLIPIIVAAMGGFGGGYGWGQRRRRTD